MIKTIEVINDLGEKLSFELGAPEKTGLWVKSIKGIGPGKANINTTDLASSDGGLYNSARSEIRNITITLGIMSYVRADGVTQSVEQVRHNTYKWFAKKKPITIIINTDVISLLTNGYVESNDPDIFQKNETMAISIVCPDPNFYAVDGTEGADFSATADKFEFPMSFKQTTDSEFLPDKLYYEYIDEEYTLTTDTEKNPSKTYYEEDVENEGFQNLIDAQYDEGYFPTQDTTMKSGKEYFEKINGEYVSTYDINSFVEGKTYYEYDSNTEFAELITIVSKSFDYDGEIEVGVNISIFISGEVSGLSIYKIYDAYNSDIISIDDQAISMSTGGGLNAGDEIKICTIKGKKSAVLIREAKEYNIMNALGKNPAWFQLDHGTNTFSYDATNGADYVSIDIEFTKAYEGV